MDKDFQVFSYFFIISIIVDLNDPSYLFLESTVIDNEITRNQGMIKANFDGQDVSSIGSREDQLRFIFMISLWWDTTSFSYFSLELFL